MRKTLLYRSTATLLFVATMALGLVAQDVPKVTSAYVLKNANVVTEPGNILENVSVIIEDGMIQAIGAKVSVPVYAKTIDCDSMFIYAGFIEGISHTGIPKSDDKGNGNGGQNNNQQKVKDPGNPPNDLAGITPEKSAVDQFKSSDKSVAEKRQLGFTASHVVPRTGMLPGMGSLIVLGEGDADALTFKKNISMYAQFQSARRMYPATLIGVMARWRDLYREASYMSKHKKAFDGSSDGVSRPRYDRATEALFPVVEGKMPVFFKTPNALHIHKALALQESLGFNLTLAEVDQSWYAQDEISASGSPVIITLDLPEKPKEKKDEEDETDPEKVAFETRRAESLEHYYSQAAMLAKSGAPMAFSTLDLKAKDFHANIRAMVEHGLSPDTALAALTTWPAQMLGVDAYMGTIAAGKMANLVVSTSRYFAEDSKVKYVFVEGKMYEYEVKKKKEKKKGDPDAAPAAVSGDWSYEVDVMGQSYTGTIKITGNDGDFQGEIISDEDGESTDLENIDLNGSKLTFTMDQTNDGGTMTLEFDLNVEGEAFDGNVAVGEFGTFPIEGSRVPK